MFPFSSVSHRSRPLGPFLPTEVLGLFSPNQPSQVFSHLQASKPPPLGQLRRAPSLAFLPQLEEDQPKRWVAAFIFPTEITPSHLTYVLYHFKTEAFNPHCAGDRLLSPPPPLRPYKRYLHLAILNHIALPSSTSLSRAPRKLSSQGSHRHVGSSPLALPHC
jgi:hypothetical protein